LRADGSETATAETADFINGNIVHRGTHDAYVNLIEANADLVLVARQPSRDELDLAGSTGVEMEIRAVALDAFVFIFNADNPLEGLTTQQIQEIYTGGITDWNEVGGNPAGIHPYQRDRNSGSQELMETLVMRDLEMIDAPDMILEGMMGPINMISEDPDGIGYSVYFYEQFMAPNEQLKLVAVDGVMPNYENIQARAYPYTTEVYAAIRTDLDETSSAHELWQWLATEQGQDAVKESGYVPVE
jgi:phosphate transport system substrate-binding protein